MDQHLSASIHPCQSFRPERARWFLFLHLFYFPLFLVTKQVDMLTPLQWIQIRMLTTTKPLMTLLTANMTQRMANMTPSMANTILNMPRHTGTHTIIQTVVNLLKNRRQGLVDQPSQTLSPSSPRSACPWVPPWWPSWPLYRYVVSLNFIAEV